MCRLPSTTSAPAVAPVAGGDAEEVLGAASRSVAVFGECGEVDVVAGEGGARDARRAYLFGEDVADRGARGPREVQRVEGGALRFGDGGRHGEARADAAAAALAQQSGAGLDRRPDDLRRVGGDVSQPGAVATVRPPRPTSAAR